MEVSSQLRALTIVTLEKDPPPHFTSCPLNSGQLGGIYGWSGCFGEAKNVVPYWESNHDSSYMQLLAISLYVVLSWNPKNAHFRVMSVLLFLKIFNVNMNLIS